MVKVRRVLAHLGVNGGVAMTFNRFRALSTARSRALGTTTLARTTLAIVGLLGSLFIRPRRVWVRAARRDGPTLVELAGLDRSAGGHLAGELDEIQRLVAVPGGGFPEDDHLDNGPENRAHGTGDESRENA